MRAPTIKEVAQLSGVGIGTVSRVINNSPQISEDTRKKVLAAIKELDYSPNMAGKRLSKSRTFTIAILVPVINHPYFSKLIAELELAADKYGYSLLVASSQHRKEKELEILKRLAQNEADGALFVTHYEHDEKDFKNLAIISIDRHLGNNIPIVTTDNYEATRKGVEYLLEKGCKKVVFLGTKPSAASEVILRQKAYEDVMDEHKLEKLIINRNINHGEEEMLIDELFEKYHDFDGIFVSGCILASHLQNKVKAMNIKVPEDLQIVSYDGDFSNDKSNMITTLEQPLDLMAEKAVVIIDKLINDNKDIELFNKFDCRFIKGKTTK